MQRLEQLERKIAQDELTKELNELKAKYPDFDDIKGTYGGTKTWYR